MNSLVLDKLLVRAEYRCEYCHGILDGGMWHKEHILPRVAKGSDNFENMAVSCPRCNLNKREKIQGKDFVTGKIEPFFNPRVDRWEDHFGIVAGQLVGKTGKGRATASRLFRRTPQVLPVNLNWSAIKEIDNEGLYRFLNHQRARRLSNEFDHLEKALKNIPFLNEAGNKDQKIATFATYILLAETLYTRSRVADLKNAFRILREASKLPNLDTNSYAELLNIATIVLQQLATVMKLEGKTAQADKIQRQAIHFHQIRMEAIGGEGIKDKLRLESLKSKLYQVEPAIFEEHLKESIDEASRGQYGGYIYLADSLTAEIVSFKKAEKLLERLDETILSMGYGQDFDFAGRIIIRRRWWLLSALLNRKCDLELLESDLSFWKGLKMENEIRELLSGLNRIDPKGKSGNIKEMMSLVRKHVNTKS